jgi:hypothetical protein
MNDPHVVSLTYRLVETEFIKFNDPPDVQIDTPDFQGRLSKDMLKLEPKEHFASEAEVRPIADDFVRGWEIAAGLATGRPVFDFRFEGSHVEDREPAPGTRSIHISDHMQMSGTVKVEKISPAYPDPPEDFHLTPEVEMLWNRYCRFIEGGELFLSMGYFCLTFLENRFTGSDKRRQAASGYGIDIDVLNKLGELTSTRGDDATARKAAGVPTPLSGREEAWINEAIKAIIKQLAIVQTGQILRMSDLPPLI